jgi:hypothetical protein
MRTTDFDLTPEQIADAERIYQVLREATEDGHWRMAQLLASRRDDRLFGQTEYELRDLAHRTGAKAIQAALDGRKKGGTRGRA